MVVTVATNVNVAEDVGVVALFVVIAITVVAVCGGDDHPVRTKISYTFMPKLELISVRTQKKF